MAGREGQSSAPSALPAPAWSQNVLLRPAPAHNAGGRGSGKVWKSGQLPRCPASSPLSAAAWAPCSAAFEASAPPSHLPFARIDERAVWQRSIGHDDCSAAATWWGQHAVRHSTIQMQGGAKVQDAGQGKPEPQRGPRRQRLLRQAFAAGPPHRRVARVGPSPAPRHLRLPPTCHRHSLPDTRGCAPSLAGLLRCYCSLLARARWRNPRTSPQAGSRLSSRVYDSHVCRSCARAPASCACTGTCNRGSRTRRWRGPKVALPIEHRYKRGSTPTCPPGILFFALSRQPRAQPLAMLCATVQGFSCGE